MSINTERKNHKVLFLDAYFHPEQIAFSHLEKDLIEYLVENGNEVYVICPTPTRGINKETCERYKKLFHEDMYNNRVHVERFWAPKEGKNTLLRAFRYIWCNIRTLFIARKYKFVDVIFVASTPPTQGMMAALAKKKLGVPFVYNLQDVFPDSLVNAKMTTKGSIIWKIGRIVEDYTYKNADKIIVISEEFKENIKKKGVPDEKIKVVPNWINTDDVYPIERENNVLVKRYNLDSDAFYITYAGNIGLSQNLQLLVDVAKEIKDDLPKVKFLMVGDGAAKETFQAEVGHLNLSNVIFLPFQPYEDIAHVYSIGDVGLVISKPRIGGSSVPSKTWSIMAAKRPVLASFDNDSELFKMVNSTDCGIAVSAGDKQGLIAAIKLLYLDKDKRKEYGDNGFSYIKNELNRDKCVGRYIEIMHKCVEGCK